MPPYWRAGMWGGYGFNPIALIDLILLCGIVVVLIFLFFAALPYAIALILLIGARYLLRGWMYHPRRMWMW